jgi:hypothetical protein
LFSLTYLFIRYFIIFYLYLLIFLLCQTLFLFFIPSLSIIFYPHLSDKFFNIYRLADDIPFTEIFNFIFLAQSQKLVDKIITLLSEEQLRLAVPELRF